MDAIEKAIRHAFEKGDAQDRAFREKVYRSAFSALERTIEGREDLTEEAKSLRREGLKRKITEIESEFVPAVEPAAPPEPTPDVPPPNEDFVPRVEREERMAPAPEAEPSPAASRSAADAGARRPAAAPAPEEGASPGRPRRSFAMMYLVVTLLAFIGIGIWWTLDSGLLRPAGERDGSVPNPPRVLEEESFAGDAPQTGAERRATGEWITVFSPSDPTTLSAPAGASAEVQEGEEEPYLRVSASGDAAVVFDVGEGVLQSLAGGSAIISIDASAEEGQETEISISCQFGPLGDCGRKRYVVGAARQDYLFEVEFPDIRPDSAGSIAIVPDISGQGRVLQLFGIRAAVAQ